MKKKGLVVSTIVMVVVLIAALSTATYAWFSVTASATVDELNINTKAADGLQIAMVNGNSIATVDNFYSGALTYENGNWNGDKGWGSNLNFAQINIGQMDNAVTRVYKGTKISELSTTYAAPVVGYKAISNAAIMSPATGITYYLATAKTISDSYDFQFGKHFGLTSGTVAQNSLLVKLENAAAGSTVYEITKANDVSAAPGANNWYCTQETSDWATVLTGKTTGTDADTILSEDIWLVPTAYAGTNPQGFTLAKANSEFYYLTMAITNMKAIGALGFSIRLTPGGTAPIGSISDSTPGMSAASRMVISTSKATAQGAMDSATTKSGIYAPFGAFKLNTANGTMSNTGAKGDGVDYGKAASDSISFAETVANGNGIYGFYLSENDVTANSVYFITIAIYIEGTDNECDNKTTGTSLGIQINFNYEQTGTKVLDWTKAELLGNEDGGKVSPIKDLIPATV